MRYGREPENFEKVYRNYLVIGYYHGKAIVKDELYRLYFIRCEENEAPIGTVAEPDMLGPVEKLSNEEYSRILEIYGPDDGKE